MAIDIYLLNAIQLTDHSAFGHVSTIRLPDMSVNRIPTIELNCKNANQIPRQDSFIVSDLTTGDCTTQIAINYQ